MYPAPLLHAFIAAAEKQAPPLPGALYQATLTDYNYPASGLFDQLYRSNRSRVITLVHAATKSFMNLSFSDA